MNTDNELKQLPLDFNLQPYMGKEDFMVSGCNCEAFQMIDNWPNWSTQSAVIYGPQGCGKSHLAHMWADKQKSFIGKPVKISILDAKRINMRNVKNIFNENYSLVIENLTAKINEEAMFHLFNMYNNEPKRYLLFTTETPPSRQHFSLKDLQSRLNMLPCVQISEPDDIMMQTLVVKLFNDRQILISPEVLKYIVENSERSYAYVQNLVEEIDAISLAYQSAVNYNIVKKAMQILDKCNPKELDLFGGEC